MRNIIRLIQKYSNFLIFLLFQVIAFVFIFNWRNSYHHTAYLNSSNNIVGQIYEWNTNFINYFNLTMINDQLKDENEELRSKLHNQEIIMGDFFSIVNDTIYKKQYEILSSKIINSKFKFRENFLIINRGKASGVYPDMGVIGTKGIIGIIVNSSSDYSSVLPVINKKFELGVRHNKTKSFGLLNWNLNNKWTDATVKDVPIYVDVKIGDYFETSGGSGIFPEGIQIGRVTKINKIKDSQFQHLHIKLNEDYSNIQTAYVVRNNSKEDLLLIKEDKNE